MGQQFNDHESKAQAKQMAMRQQLSDLGMATRELARVVREYYNGLVEQGFSKNEALALSSTFSATMFATLFGGNK